MKITTELFIIKSNLIHKNKYDYSLVEYKNTRTKVKIICPEHGVFEQLPKNHMSGQGCIYCSGKNKLNTIDIIKKFKDVHGDKYNYSLVDYKNSITKVKIICPEHGIFEQLPQKHFNKKQGCPKCFGLYKTTKDIIDEFKDVHSDKYDYSLVDYKTAKSKVNIICKKHGIFSQKPNDHLRGIGCPICNNSKGENIIMEYSNMNNINCITQKIFQNCKNKRCLPFDFYLPEYNMCIEYDGIQHFIPYFKGGTQKTLEETKFKDNIKTNFCKDNSIILLRISYKENIIEKLKNNI